MKFLHVYGDDFAALYFEQNYNVNEIVEKIKENDGESISIDKGDVYFDAQIVEFKGNIDKDFIDWIKSNFIDYDDMKHDNFYEIKEKEKEDE